MANAGFFKDFKVLFIIFTAVVFYETLPGKFVLTFFIFMAFRKILMGLTGTDDIPPPPLPEERPPLPEERPPLPEERPPLPEERPPFHRPQIIFLHNLMWALRQLGKKGEKPKKKNIIRRKPGHKTKMRCPKRM